MSDPLTSISPLDGRYSKKVETLRGCFSEMALMRYRLLVEVEWFLFLCNDLKLPGTRVWNSSQIKQFRKIYESFDLADAQLIKKIEQQTNHDVKAVEYFLKAKIPVGNRHACSLQEFIHFGCTSEDINNLAYALMLKDALKDEILPTLNHLQKDLFDLAKKHKNVAMVARTHGQIASPTTMGKELMNFVARLDGQKAQLKQIKFLAKINGAVGNYNPHLVAYPEVKWIEASKIFIQHLGLEQNLYTTQIEPHDGMAEFFDNLRRINTILIDFNRDIWTYISLGYFQQELKSGEVGSSTMPHKINPIDFENSEGNLGLANALFHHFSEKLPISRLQRDLTDSTVLRNIGSAIAYCLIAYKNCIQGLQKLELNKKNIQDDLNDAWELLAEPIQTVMRKHHIEKSYEKLKTLTRGKNITQKTLHKFIDGLKIPVPEKKRLKLLTPSAYIGLAVRLVDLYSLNE